MYFKYVFAILVFQIVYDTGCHRASSGQFHTPHMVCGCPASLPHQANDRPTHYRFFNFLTLGAYPSAKVHQRGDDLLPT